MSKQEFEIMDIDLIGEWRKVAGTPEGVMEKILSYDPQTGNYSRMLKFPPQTKIIKELAHDFCEEVYVVSGYLIDLGKDITIAPGYYGSRLPEMKHGPYDIPLGCTTIEFRYQEPNKPLNPECSLIKEKLGAPR
ncbi:MAG: hypothetical protein STSR0007_01420 [Thermovirga sp.]